MGRFIIIAVTVAGLLYGCANSRPPAQEPPRDSRDTFAFAKYGKGVFFGVNAILRSDTSMILVTNQDIFKTSNSGASWESLAEPLPHKNITAVTAFADTIYAGSGHGTVYRSTDHGLQWRVHRRLGSNAVKGFSKTAEPIASDNLARHCWPHPTSSCVKFGKPVKPCWIWRNALTKSPAKRKNPLLWRGSLCRPPRRVWRPCKTPLVV